MVAPPPASVFSLSASQNRTPARPSAAPPAVLSWQSFAVPARRNPRREIGKPAARRRARDDREETGSTRGPGRSGPFSGWLFPD
jgi:hypothetical protein